MALRSRLFPMLLLFSWGVCVAADPATVASRETLRWLLEDPAVVGGHSTTVLGSPQVRPDAGVGAPSLFFDGVDDGILVPVNPLEGAAAFTIEILFKPDSTGPEEQRFFHVQDNLGNRCLLETRLIGGRWALDGFLSSIESKQKLVLLDRTKTHPSDRWTWVALVYGDGKLTHYINGIKELEGPVEFSPLRAGRISLGVRQNRVSWFKGGLREVRLHRTALPPEQLQRAPDAVPPPRAPAEAAKSRAARPG